MEMFVNYAGSRMSYIILSPRYSIIHPFWSGKYSEKLLRLQILDCYQTTLEESKHAIINKSNSHMQQDTILNSSSRYFLHGDGDI